MTKIASKSSTMPVLLDEGELAGTVKQWSNMKKIEAQY